MQHHPHGILRFKRDGHAIQGKKQARQHLGGSLVSVGERVIARQPEGIGGGKHAGIGLPIGPSVAWAREVQHRSVTHADWTAVLGPLAIVDGKRQFDLDPDRFHRLGHTT